MESPSENSDLESKQPESFTPQKRGWWRRKWAIIKSLWNEKDMWVNTAAVKAGAGALWLTAAVGISYAVALPFAFAAIAITACAAFAGLGLYGVLHGLRSITRKVDAAVRRAAGKPERTHTKKGAPVKNFFQSLNEKEWVQKLKEKKIIRKLRATRAWKIMRNFAFKQSNGVMVSLALGGSAGSIIVGAAVLATQVMILPIVLTGVLMAGTVFFTVRGIADNIQVQRAQKKASKTDAPPPLAESVPAATPAASLTDTFESSAAAARPPENISVPVPPPKPI